MTDNRPPQPSEAPNADASSAITEDIVKLALRRVKDPELNLNIVDIGLVYAIRVSGTEVSVDMSLTTPACPSGPEILENATQELQDIEGVTKANVNVVWDPPWTPDRIEPRVRVYLGF